MNVLNSLPWRWRRTGKSRKREPVWNCTWPKTKHNMPGRCVVGGCINVPSKNVSLCLYPADTRIWSKWDTFIRSTRKWDRGSAKTYVCSEHFREEDFSNYRQWKMGFCSKLLLNPGVAPTVKPTKATVQYAATDTVPQGRKSTARTKLNFEREVSLVTRPPPTIDQSPAPSPSVIQSSQIPFSITITGFTSN